MARNQRRTTVDLRWRRLGFALVTVSAIVCLTIGYVVQRRAHEQLGIQIRRAELEVQWARDRLGTQVVQIHQLLRRETLQRRAAEHQLGLTNLAASQRQTVPLIPTIQPPTEAMASGSPVRSPATGIRAPFASAPAIPLRPAR